MNRKGRMKKAGASLFSLSDSGTTSAAYEIAVTLRLLLRAERLYLQSLRQLKMIDKIISSHLLFDSEKLAMIDGNQRKLSVWEKEAGKILAIVTRVN
jgi:hypothetical protein